MGEYLLKIKSIIGALISVCTPITYFDHVEAILNGLTEECGLFMTTMISRVEPILVGELEALLMA